MSNDIEVTDVTVRPFEADGEDSSLKAFADIVFNGKLVVRGVKVVEGKHGLFLSWPSRKTKNKERPFLDLVYSLDKDLHTHIWNKVESAYKESLTETGI
jgi:stage V sporulation protein G